MDCPHFKSLTDRTVEHRLDTHPEDACQFKRERIGSELADAESDIARRRWGDNLKVVGQGHVPEQGPIVQRLSGAPTLDEVTAPGNRV